MRRLLIIISLSIVFVFALGAGELLAATETWPGLAKNLLKRGPGFYLSWPKILASWIVFMCWVRTTDWVNVDCQEVKALDFARWNPIVFGTFMAAFVLTWLIPNFGSVLFCY